MRPEKEIELMVGRITKNLITIRRKSLTDASSIMYEALQHERRALQWTLGIINWDGSPATKARIKCDGKGMYYKCKP